MKKYYIVTPQAGIWDSWPNKSVRGLFILNGKYLKDIHGNNVFSMSRDVREIFFEIYFEAPDHTNRYAEMQFLAESGDIICIEQKSSTKYSIDLIHSRFGSLDVLSNEARIKSSLVKVWDVTDYMKKMEDYEQSSYEYGLI